MAHPDQLPLPDAVGHYDLWSRLTRVGAWQLTKMRNDVHSFGYRPKVSVLLPVYNPKRAWFERALDSVISQAYPHWELCVCNDGSVEPHVKEVLGFYQRLDERIQVRHLVENAGIVVATNQAFSLASGEFVGLLDHDDALAPHALFEVVSFLQANPNADLIYSDHEVIDEDGHGLRPGFKPGWSPDSALSGNYLLHLSVYRRSLLEELGGWREGLDGAQDFDLMLRYTEKTDEIHRLPKILYSWRSAEGSVASDPGFKPYTHERARRAIRDALARRGIRGAVLDTGVTNAFRIEREIEGSPKVSVLIRFREGADLDRCVGSLERLTQYPNYEVILLATRTNSFKSRVRSKRTKVVRVAETSTLLEMYNGAIAQAESDYLLFLDPDAEALSEGWLEALLQHAQRPEVGAVGGKLVTEGGRTLSAGVVVSPEEREDISPTFYRPFNRQHPGLRMFVNRPRNCSAVSGSCMMLRKAAFEAAGGFNADCLGDTFGDVDLCLRLRERGFLIVYTPYAEFVGHHGLPTAGLGPDQANYVRDRWGDVLEGDPYYNPNLLWTASDIRSVLSLSGLMSPAPKSRGYP